MTLPHDTHTERPSPPERILLLLSVAMVLAFVHAFVAEIICRRRACVFS